MSSPSNSFAQESGELSSLPAFLTNSWRLGRFDQLSAKLLLDRDEWTVSSLTKAYLKAQLLGPSTRSDRRTNYNLFGMTPSLVSISVGKIIQLLENSGTLEADVMTIKKSLDPIALRQVLRDPRMPYPLLRAFLNMPEEFTTESKVSPEGTLRDVDEAVLLNEQYIRSRSSDSPRDGKYLVTLADLAQTLGNSMSNCSPTFLIRRKDPPPGGFELLDEKRQRTVQILANDEAFSSTFERITRGILKGLDWQNVLVAGGLALTTLMHVDVAKDRERTICDGDIDIYIYGLDYEEANAKVEHIYNIWSSNLPVSNEQKLVVKNAKTITFLADYPNRRVQIILKLLSSPTEILLNFDIDPCAIGFDGTHVQMLPRCARAIETGYSTFTMDLIWGHYLGNRRATRENRLFKYADRGFGMRILPCYVQSLEDNTHWAAASALGAGDAEAGDGSQSFQSHSTDHENYSAYRKSGSEPGLKSLRRIAFIGQGFTDHFWIRRSPFRHDLDSDEMWTTNNQEIWGKWTGFKEAYEARIADGERLSPLEIPLIDLTILDSRTYRHGSIPNGLAGLGAFEMLMRHCEAWRLDARGQATLDRTAYPDFGYDESSYNDSPQYGWNENFRATELALVIDRENNQLFVDLKHAICSKLNIPYQQFGYRNYLTRRIRRQVHGPDLESVMEKQITIPLVVPYELENYITNDIPQAHPDLPYHNTNKPLLIPVHNSTSHDPTSVLPSLTETASEDGNLRYWIINNENMWACQHRTLDEVFEVLWSLFHCFNQQYLATHHFSLANLEATWGMTRMFRRRAILPEFATTSETTISTNGISVRESLLFRAWAFAVPRVNEGTVGLHDESTMYFMAEDFNLPPTVPDERFWKDGDEGNWSGVDIPQWFDVP